MREGFRIHTRPRVRNLEHQLLPRGNGAGAARATRLCSRRQPAGGNLLRAGPEGENPSVGHRLRRVQAQAHDSLLQLEDVRQDRGGGLVEFETHLHRRGKGRFENRDVLPDDPVDRDDIRALPSLPGVRQKLPRQIRSPARHPVDRDEISGRFVVPRQQQEEHLHRAGDPHEQVVEFVRHPPGQHPDRLELLAFRQAAFHQPPLRDVSRDPENLGRRPALPPHGGTDRLHLRELPVLPPEAVMDRQSGRLPRGETAIRRPHHLLFLRREKSLAAAADHLLRA